MISWILITFVLRLRSVSAEVDPSLEVNQTTNHSSSPEVLQIYLRQGPIIAEKQSTDIPDRYYYAFRGIPYAKPPVGKLRFQDPVPSGRWSELRNGSVIPPQCPQIAITFYTEGKLEVVGEEDCLYLNVFSPKVERNRERGLPVMVWIHGGAFSFGNSSFYKPLPLLNHDIILVTIQYRLETLGFLSTEDPVIPGNFGLKDQTLALRWIKENIDSFGGDDSRITLFGQSAGAASVHFQMMVADNYGLFHRVILQSGSALCPWALASNHREVAMKIGQLFNCSSVSKIRSDRLLSCLQEAPVKELTLAAQYFAVWHFAPAVMKPRIDGSYLENHPAYLLKNNYYRQVNMLSGNTKDEGADYALDVLRNPDWVSAVKNNFKEAAPVALRMGSETEDPEHMARRAFYHYVNDVEINENINGFVKLISDRLYTACQDEAAKFHSKGSDSYGPRIYRYKLLHRGQNSYSDPYENPLSKNWVTHADDLQYLFESTVWPFQPLERPDDLFVRDIMLKMWTNFARDGNPTPSKSLGFRWTPMRQSEMEYLAIQTVPEMKPDEDCKMRTFWRDFPIIQNDLLHDEDCNKEKTEVKCIYY
ncbi:Carboxylesterase 5A [Halocaridina rubra]|uniref:Carboxylic ester hydrolase n=1 Tax=Halocaridina rubra TaxID=373956 RepID=A0AAN8WTA3_HALRR